jgi:hypothetical protein
MERKAMDINLTPEQEKIVKDELKSGHFRSVEEVIGEALQVLREKGQSSTVGAPNGAQREAVREMLAFVEKNRVRMEGVSVKELIHEGHRLCAISRWTRLSRIALRSIDSMYTKLAVVHERNSRIARRAS